jgi:hypothetical protein
MKTKLYKQTEQFVVDSFNKANEPQPIKHLLRTAYWLKKIYPKADEAMLIAAVTHDIERAFRKDDTLKRLEQLSYIAVEILRPHEEQGAEVISSYLKQWGANDQLIDKVKMLVSRHEEGGTDEQNIIKDADSVSFFENQIEYFLTTLLKKDGKEKIKEKLDWMFDRITSEKAKKFSKKWYEEAISKLNS